MFGGSQINPYDVQDRAINGDPIVLSGSGMYYSLFPVDVSGLAEGYHIQFDLYAYYLDNKEELKLDKAPFSHDAQSNGNGVPEPGTMLLLGLGLLGVAGFGIRRKK